ncbi:hypothetical protein [Streptomyces lunalinharesii]|uniref:Uncharacterized protein n=1 Tax=Streptomyces lunalinharesii TaxID=333384 RepID=A0ABN3S404_9ACTN
MDRSLVSVRAALVLLLVALTGIGVGLLSVLAGDGTARAILAGLAAAGAALPVCNRAIAPDAATGRPAAGTERVKGGSIRG